MGWVEDDGRLRGNAGFLKVCLEDDFTLVS